MSPTSKSDSNSLSPKKKPLSFLSKQVTQSSSTTAEKDATTGKNSSKTELSDASSVSVTSNATSTSEVSLKSKNKKLEPPDGFKMLSRTKSGKVRLQAPDGKILLSYRAAWERKENDEEKNLLTFMDK